MGLDCTRWSTSNQKPGLQRTQAIKALSGYCKIAITGTPLENRLLDVWSIFDFSLPDLLGDVNEFESRFQENEDCISFLEQIISPFIIRRKIAEVIDMPSIITYDHEITMHDSEQRSLLNISRRNIWRPAHFSVSTWKDVLLLSSNSKGFRWGSEVPHKT